MKKMDDTEVEVDGENQPVVEVTEEATTANNGARSRLQFQLLKNVYNFWHCRSSTVRLTVQLFKLRRLVILALFGCQTVHKHQEWTVS